MWICEKCGETIEDGFKECWICAKKDYEKNWNKDKNDNRDDLSDENSLNKNKNDFGDDLGINENRLINNSSDGPIIVLVLSIVCLSFFSIGIFFILIDNSNSNPLVNVAFGFILLGWLLGCPTFIASTILSRKYNKLKQHKNKQRAGTAMFLSGIIILVWFISLLVHKLFQPSLPP